MCRRGMWPLESRIFELAPISAWTVAQCGKLENPHSTVLDADQAPFVQHTQCLADTLAR